LYTCCLALSNSRQTGAARCVPHLALWSS